MASLLPALKPPICPATVHKDSLTYSHLQSRYYVRHLYSRIMSYLAIFVCKFPLCITYAVPNTVTLVGVIAGDGEQTNTYMEEWVLLLIM